MAKNESKLTVITKAELLCEYILNVTKKSPKVFRFTYVSRLQGFSLDVLEKLYSANRCELFSSDECKLRLRYQRFVEDRLHLLDFISRIAVDVQCISPKQNEEIARQISEVLKALRAWEKSDENRLQGTGL